MVHVKKKIEAPRSAPNALHPGWPGRNKTMQCPHCNATVDADTIFCGNCGKQIMPLQPGETVISYATQADGNPVGAEGIETRYGERLEKSVVNQAGDFIFIPPDLPHQPINLSQDEPAIGIVARNDPNEQESVVVHEVLAGLRRLLE